MLLSLFMNNSYKVWIQYRLRPIYLLWTLHIVYDTPLDSDFSTKNLKNLLFISNAYIWRLTSTAAQGGFVVGSLWITPGRLEFEQNLWYAEGWTYSDPGSIEEHVQIDLQKMCSCDRLLCAGSWISERFGQIFIRPTYPVNSVSHHSFLFVRMGK